MDCKLDLKSILFICLVVLALQHFFNIFGVEGYRNCTRIRRVIIHPQHGRISGMACPGPVGYRELVRNHLNAQRTAQRTRRIAQFRSRSQSQRQRQRQMQTQRRRR